MLKIHRKVEYGLIAIKHLYHVKPPRLVSAREIAEHYGIPAAPLAHVLRLLSNAGLVEATHGIKGGYRLCAQTTQIRFSQFIEIISGNLAFTDCQKESPCTCSILTQCNIAKPMDVFQQRLKQFLQSITLSALIIEPPAAFMPIDLHPRRTSQSSA